MEKTSGNKPIKHICTGLLAHVDAGKTTLSEGILYLSKSIRKLGRVDNKDAFLDTYELERARGITIFSKQAVLSVGDMRINLLDTPGHVDFSAEMERTLQVLDYAILVISGADGVQGHTLTLWRLLKKYRIPVFLFVNKMDQNGANRGKLFAELKDRLDENCVDFGEDQTQTDFMENLAMCDDALLDSYMENSTIDLKAIVKLIADRKIFPCYFGSALKLEGVESLFQGIQRYTAERSYTEEFGAKVFKIARDDQGTRLTYMKITGGRLKVKDVLTNAAADRTRADEVWEQKVHQIRIYSGAKFEAVNDAPAGTVCAVTGLSKTYPGQGLGVEPPSLGPVLEPVLTYQMILPEGCDANQVFWKLKQLEEEEPQLHLVWDEKLGEIQAQLMGEIQNEILKSLIQERFGIAVEFGTGNILYKETIQEPVEGVGHFEPLRHYAEVHLLMEPGKLGSGLQFAADCSEDLLSRNWQRLILTHLEEREHRGVLTGSVITDMKITLIGGRSHQKHTEGGDFRQATYRAVRQGLCQAKCTLLEPYYEFRLEVPAEQVGRALADIERMHGTATPPMLENELSVLSGLAPVAAMRDYQIEVAAYSRGRGRLSCTLKGYEPCHNADEVIERIHYDVESDLENPCGSVFCNHGAGFVVPWGQVVDYMHVEGRLLQKKRMEENTQISTGAIGYDIDSIVDAGWTDNYIPRYNPVAYEQARKRQIAEQKEYKKAQEMEEYLLVDGYNIIFAWEELKELANVNIDSARDKLMDILCNYQGFKGCNLILVFDAYKVKENTGNTQEYYNIHVVYTKEAETADQYIEKFAHQMGRKYKVTVATSDGLEQVIIRGQGCRLLSARELEEEIELAAGAMQEEIQKKQKTTRAYLLQHAPEDMTEGLEDIRLGKKKWEDI